MKNFVALIAVLFTYGLFAQQFGYIDYNRLLEMEGMAKKLSQELEKQEKSILDDEQKARTEIEAEMNKFKDATSKLSDKARAEQGAKLSAKINELEQQFTKRRADLNKKRLEISQSLEKQNLPIVENLAKEKKFIAVFNSQSLVFASDNMIDITPMVAERFNKAYPVKEEKKPAPKKK